MITKEMMLNAVDDLRRDVELKAAYISECIKNLEIPSVDLHDGSMSFAVLKELLDSGKLVLHVGDQVSIKHAALNSIRWTVIGVGVDAQHVYARRQTVTLQMTYCAEEYRWFSIPTRKHRCGHNAWDSSSLRQWLNGDFINGFSAEDRSALIPAVKTTYRCNVDGGNAYTTSDKVFILSASELGFTGRKIRDEGAVYPFYDSHPENRVKVDDDSGVRSIYWTRSCDPWSVHRVRFVSACGTLGDTDAYNGSGLAAACVI